jgi:hypothetical protein
MSVTYRPLELVHVDLCGPLSETNAGQKYFMAVMDDYSKYAEVLVMTEKSEAKKKLLNVLTKWENQREFFIRFLWAWNFTRPLGLLSLCSTRWNSCACYPMA